ncbi:MAG: Ig-like domain-containing protein, partial [Planctomycetota bacterium]
MDVSVGDHDGVPLNEILVLTFSEELDRDTVRPETIQVREGPNYGRQVPGEFRVEGRRVEFFPRLPILPDLSDSGFQPAMDYKVILPGQPDVSTVRSVGNNRLKKTTTVRFRTAAAGSPDLFRDNFLDATPPHVQFVNPPDGAVEVRADSEITITFNRRALNPVTVNASNITLTLVERGNTPVHRIVSGVPVLEQTHDSVVVKFVPTFPLADEARYILHVDRRVQDLVGNDIDPGFESEFSIRDEPARFSEFELSFDATEKAILMDPDESTASWNEDVEGALAALFTVAGGNATAGDLKPVANRQIAPADFPRGHEVMSIDGHECDVYNFREISIPAGTTVRFTSAPGEPDRSVVLLSLKPVLIEGTLTVSGGDGQDSERSSTNTKLVVAAGGAAGPGGTQGSDSYDGTKVGVNYPQSEGDAGDVEPGGEGGRGGDCSSSTAYSVAGGGGGGGARTAGLNGTKGGSTTTSWRGAAGKGGRSTDQRSYPVNLERRPNVGGAGGGAGGLGGHNGRGWRTGGGGGGG